MCIAQDRRAVNKAAPKAAIKLPVAKHHELLATASSVGKAVHLHRNPSNETLTTMASHESSHHHDDANSATTIAAPSPTKDATDSLASNNDTVNNIHQEQKDAFDFDLSFLQIPTGGIINIPRQGDHECHDGDMRKHVSFASDEATIPTAHIRMRPKPLDLASLGIILKPKYRGGVAKQQQAKEDANVPTATTLPSPRCTTPGKDFQAGTVRFEDFVYETPKQMQRMVGLTTPPTTPRASGHPSFFVDYAKIPESLLIPLYH